MNETQTARPSANAADRIDLRDVFLELKAFKWLILGISTVAAIISIIVALWLPNQYKATVTLVPTLSTSSSSLASLASQFGGLASIAGISLGGDAAVEKSVIALELVKNWGFLDSFIQEHNLQVEIFAAKGWDRARDEIIIDSDLYDKSTGKWVRDFDPKEGETPEPGSWELYTELKDRITVSQDISSGLITLSVEYYSPTIAKEWVDKLVAALNLHLRLRDREEASKSIEFLQKQIDQTSLAEMKNVFYQLVEEQTKNLMLTEVNDEYVLSTLSPARIPEEKSWPNRALICISGTLFGFVFMSHQFGAFIGIYLGGFLYEVQGSYDFVWQLAGYACSATRKGFATRPSSGFRIRGRAP